MKNINSNFKQKKDSILTALSELERTSDKLDPKEMEEKMGDVGNDILMINKTPAARRGEVLYIGKLKQSQIALDVVTQGTIKPKVKF